MRLRLSGGIRIEANMVNYGSLAAIQGLTSAFSEETMLPVLNQVAPIAVRGILVSEKGLIYLGRRANSTYIGGKIDTYPAVCVGEGEGGLSVTLEKEALEEASFRIGEDGEAHLIGLTRGKNTTSWPCFNFIIRTDWSLETLRKNTGREHDEVYAVELDPNVLRARITDDLVVADPGKNGYDRITEHGLSALLQVGKSFFGANWYQNLARELQDRYPFTMKISENDSLFA